MFVCREYFLKEIIVIINALSNIIEHSICKNVFNSDFKMFVVFL